MSQEQYTPHIEWFADAQSLYIRFARVPRSQFGRLLDYLQGTISSYKWNAEKRAWELPHSDIQAVALFAELNFGKNAMVYIGRNPQPQQLGLPFHE